MAQGRRQGPCGLAPASQPGPLVFRHAGIAATGFAHMEQRVVAGTMAIALVQDAAETEPARFSDRAPTGIGQGHRRDEPRTPVEAVAQFLQQPVLALMVGAHDIKCATTRAAQAQGPH